MEIQIIGLEKLNNRIDGFKKRLADLSPAFADSGDVILQEFKANFSEEGRILTDGWQPRKKSYPWPILEKTGKLKNTWNSKIENKKLTISSPIEYATYHQFGTPKMPARKIVGITKSLLENVIDRIKKYLLTP